MHSSPGLEVGVYVLVAPEEDKQVPHVLDEIYLVLDGDGEIEVDGRAPPDPARRRRVRTGRRRSTGSIRTRS